MRAGQHDQYSFSAEELFAVKSSSMLPGRGNKKLMPLEVDNLTYVSSNSSSIDDNDSEDETNTKLIGAIVRAVFILLCTLVATCFPCFGMVCCVFRRVLSTTSSNCCLLVYEVGNVLSNSSDMISSNTISSTCAFSAVGGGSSSSSSSSAILVMIVIVSCSAATNYFGWEQ